MENMGRRSFLKGSAAFAALAGVSFKNLMVPSVARAQEDIEPPQLASQFLNRMVIEADNNSWGGTLTIKTPSAERKNVILDGAFEDYVSSKVPNPKEFYATCIVPNDDDNLWEFGGILPYNGKYYFALAYKNGNDNTLAVSQPIDSIEVPQCVFQVNEQANLGFTYKTGVFNFYEGWVGNGSEIGNLRELANLNGFKGCMTESEFKNASRQYFVRAINSKNDLAVNVIRRQDGVKTGLTSHVVEYDKDNDRFIANQVQLYDSNFVEVTGLSDLDPKKEHPVRTSGNIVLNKQPYVFTNDGAGRDSTVTLWSVGPLHSVGGTPNGKCLLLADQNGSAILDTEKETLFMMPNLYPISTLTNSGKMIGYVKDFGRRAYQFNLG